MVWDLDLDWFDGDMVEKWCDISGGNVTVYHYHRILYLASESYGL